MFTGIIEKVLNVESMYKKENITFKALGINNSNIGDSISINGTCLTISSINLDIFKCDLSPETICKTTFKNLKKGDKVNFERAVSFGSKMSGHIISGHVDGIGKIVDLCVKRDFRQISLEIPKYLSKYCVTKGSISIDGISLTINKIIDQSENSLILLSIIPYTFENTNIKFKKIGDFFNIETDIIAKHLERLCQGYIKQ